MENSSRREFLEKNTTALATGTVLMALTGTAVEVNSIKGENHLLSITYFWLKDPKNKQGYDKLLAGLRGLDKIKKLSTYWFAVH